MRICIICGARVRNRNQSVNTCSPLCTRAKKAKRSRYEQILFELEHPEINHDEDPPQSPKTCGVCGRPIDVDATSCEACGSTDFED
jgi:predicted nucleic acid-binding Zn ribbon protein